MSLEKQSFGPQTQKNTGRRDQITDFSWRYSDVRDCVRVRVCTWQITCLFYIVAHTFIREIIVRSNVRDCSQLKNYIVNICANRSNFCIQATKDTQIFDARLKERAMIRHRVISRALFVRLHSSSSLAAVSTIRRCLNSTFFPAVTRIALTENCHFSMRIINHTSLNNNLRSKFLISSAIFTVLITLVLRTRKQK